MLSVRIYKVHRATQRYVFQDSLNKSTGNYLLKGVMLIIIESGLLYTATAFVSFLMAVTGSTAIYTTTHAVRFSLLFETSCTEVNNTVKEIQVVGISFNLIIIRASQLRNTRLRRDDCSAVVPRITPVTLHIMPVDEIVSDIKGDNQVLPPPDEESSIGGQPRQIELNTDETSSK